MRVADLSTQDNVALAHSRERAGRGTTAVVASFGTYSEAERAVEAIADGGVAIDRVLIVGRGLRLVEHVVRRASLLSTTASGVGSGVAVAVFFAAVFALFSNVPGGGLLVWAVVVGAVAGAVFGAAWFVGARAKFETKAAFEADRYDVEVDDRALAGRAAELVDRAQDVRLSARGASSRSGVLSKR